MAAQIMEANRSKMQKSTGALKPAVETYPLRSIDAAARMASKTGDNGKERAEYSRLLTKESGDLADYIIGKKR